MGERSAYGLPDESGALVLETGVRSLLAASGLKPKDVIRMADGEPVKTAKDLLDIVQSSAWKGKIPVVVIRNQQEVGLTLLLK